MGKIPITVLNDPKYDLGKGYKNEEGEYIQTEYTCDQDSIFGDCVYDALIDLVSETKFKDFYAMDQHERMNTINRKLENEGLNYVQTSIESADRLRTFCEEYFFGLFEENLDFEIIYFHCLEDAEQFDLSKALVL